MNDDRLSIVDHEDRRIVFGGVHNFRDLGGYELADGRTIGWGRLFRADGLYRLTEADIDVIDSLGIRTVVDLRSAGEVADHGCFPIERYPVDFHALPIMDVTWRDSVIPEVEPGEQGDIDFLTWAYFDMLESGSDRFAHAIRVLAAPQVGPAVFHCAAGKDRTGVLAALVLGGLGVESDIIVADYGLTREAMGRLLAWVKANNPEMAARMGTSPSFMLAANPEAMANVINGLVADHGSIRDYLATIGIDAAVLNALGDNLAG
ncbi:MAG: protein-tyrosine phosphatase [Ilumatobacter sp.]